MANSCSAMRPGADRLSYPFDFEGRLCKNGNAAYPFSPADIEAGQVFKFSLFHVVRTDDPHSMFPSNRNK